MTRLERRKQWEARIAAFKDSDQNISSWCRDHDISHHQLRYWLKKLDSKNEVKSQATSRWMTVNVSESHASHPSIQIKID